MAATEIDPPDERGLNQRVVLHTKGWLPYTLPWELVVTSSRYPEHIGIEAIGDFVGSGVWTITQDGECVNATYDWRIRAEKPLFQRLAPFMRPLLEANHRWAMSQGEESLKLELLRRRAVTPEARRSVPPPPGPVTLRRRRTACRRRSIGGSLGYLMLRASRKAPA